MNHISIKLMIIVAQLAYITILIKDVIKLGSTL